jgi:DNA-binding MarR family transcriptional regulator
MTNQATSESSAAAPPTSQSWRLTHLGRLMGNALRRFDERVLWLMARNVDVPLSLANLAARDQVGAAHIHITRHLDVSGSRLTDLASSAGMSKQAMADLVNQCEAWGLVLREADPHDRRARRVRFTEAGLLWLQAFEHAVEQAEREFRQAVGPDVAIVVALGLEAYGNA